MILAGSVLKETYDWTELMRDGVGRLVNECGKRDVALLVNQAAPLMTGMAGRVGFVGFENDRLHNRYHDFGHSDYFKGDFMQSKWVPLITEKSPPEAFPRGQATLAAGVWETILRNIAPVKLLVFGLILNCVVSCSLTSSLEKGRARLNDVIADSAAETQAREEQDNTIRHAVGEGQSLVARGEPERGLLWLVRGLRALEQSPVPLEFHQERALSQRIRIARVLEGLPVPLSLSRFDAPLAVAYLPGGRTLVASRGGGIHLLDAATLEPLRDPVAPKSGILLTVPLPHDRLAAVHDDGRIGLWDTTTWTRLSGLSAGDAADLLKASVILRSDACR